jgi:hypothetical protein
MAYLSIDDSINPPAGASKATLEVGVFSLFPAFLSMFENVNERVVRATIVRMNMTFFFIGLTLKS